MAYPLLTYEIPPPRDFGPEPRPNQVGTAILGWAGGRPMEFSDERGPALPAEGTVTTHGVVALYDDSLVGYDTAMLFASATEDADGGTSPDYGPLFEINEPTGNRGQKWWTQSDWSKGLIAHFLTGAAAGQWAILDGRQPSNPFAFKLTSPLEVPAEPGDTFRIGQLAWAVFAPIAAPVMSPSGGVHSTMLALETGRLALKPLRGALRGGLEAYLSGAAWALDNPGYPYRGATLLALPQADQSVLQEFAIISFAGPGPDGNGTLGREISLAFRDVVDYNDFKLDCVAVELTGRGGGS